MAPIKTAGRPVGAIVVKSSDLVDECLPGAKQLARAISMALELAAQRSERRRATREAAVNASIAELSKMLIGQVPMHDLSYLVLQEAKRLPRSRCGFVGYIDPQTGHLIRPTLTRDIMVVREVVADMRRLEGRDHQGLRLTAVGEETEVTVTLPTWKKHTRSLEDIDATGCR